MDLGGRKEKVRSKRNKEERRKVASQLKLKEKEKTSSSQNQRITFSFFPLFPLLFVLNGGSHRKIIILLSFSLSLLAKVVGAGR
jgi:hypothetical protein